MSDKDQNAAGSGFGRFVPGFEFLQSLAGQAAGGMAKGMGESVPQMPSLGNWVAPTFNVEDLEKRIQELKAVQFWLDQNAKALAATIQALEVQKMTLATLQTMNLSMGDVASSLKNHASQAIAGFTGAAAGAPAPGEEAPAPAPTQFAGLEIPPRTYGTPPAAAEPEPEPEPVAPAPEAAATAPAPAPAGVIDPLQWWGALSQQFQQIASQALQEVGRPAPTPAADDTPPAPAAPRAAPAPRRARAPAKAAKPAKKASPRAAAAPQSLGSGDWPMPSSFFQLPGFPDMKPAPKKKPAKAAAAKTASAAPARKSAAKKAPAKKAAPAGRRR